MNMYNSNKCVLQIIIFSMLYFVSVSNVFSVQNNHITYCNQNDQIMQIAQINRPNQTNQPIIQQFSNLFDSDVVDNPIFISWSKYNPGTKLVFKQTSSIGNQFLDFMLVYELASKTSDKVIIEMYGLSKASNESSILSKTRLEIPSKVNIKFDDNVSNIFRAKNFNKKELLTINQKSYECFTLECYNTQEFNEIRSKFWYCEDIPGCFVKSEVEVYPNIAVVPKNIANASDDMKLMVLKESGEISKQNAKNAKNIKLANSKNAKSNVKVSSNTKITNLSNLTTENFIKAKVNRPQKLSTKTILELVEIHLVY